MQKISSDEWQWIAKKSKIYSKNPQVSKLESYKKSSKNAKANINFYSEKKSKGAKNFSRTLSHNKRLESDQDYFLPQDQREKNEYLDLEKNLDLVALDKKIRDDYLEFHKRKMPYNSQTTTEAILNISENHNCQNILKAIEKLDLPMKPLQISIHRDEGHFNQLTQSYEKNYHAHIVFLNYDFKAHRTLKRTMSKKDFAELPKKLAESLNMELNQDKKQGYHLNRFQLEHRFNKQAERTLEALKIEQAEQTLKSIYSRYNDFAIKKELVDSYKTLLDLTSKDKELEFLEQINSNYHNEAKAEIEMNIQRAKDKEKTINAIQEQTSNCVNDMFYQIRCKKERSEINSSMLTNITRKTKQLSNKQTEKDLLDKIQRSYKILNELISNNENLKELREIKLNKEVICNTDPFYYHKEALDLINKNIAIARDPKEYISEVAYQRNTREKAKQQERKQAELERQAKKQEYINKAIERQKTSDKTFTRGKSLPKRKNDEIER